MVLGELGVGFPVSAVGRLTHSRQGHLSRRLPPPLLAGAAAPPGDLPWGAQGSCCILIPVC